MCALTRGNAIEHMPQYMSLGERARNQDVLKGIYYVSTMRVSEAETLRYTPLCTKSHMQNTTRVY